MKFVSLMLLTLLCAAAADEKDAALLPDGPGKAAVVKMCIDCHDTGNFRKARLTAEEWTDSVADMMQRGAQGTPAEVDAAVAYLDKFFGKGAPVRINTAPFSEIRVVLGFSVPEVRALLEYRDKNGPFKTFEDLAKVPGLDAAKLATQKAKIRIE
ncbi:MAG: helix-hairpin-helix domain-containing protein [Candidatus Solibacter sp.]